MSVSWLDSQMENLKYSSTFHIERLLLRICELLLEYEAEYQLSREEIHKEFGISRKEVKKILKCDHSISLKTVVKILLHFEKALIVEEIE